MTMTLIETKTLVSAAASIEFTSIPQTFTDLVLKLSIRGATTGSNDGVLLRVNAITSGYSTRSLTGNGTSAGSELNPYGVTNAAYITSVVTSGSNFTSNTFSNGETYIPNYAGATNKSFSHDAVQENNATESFMNISAGLLTNTAAITSLLIFTVTGSGYVTGSTISLYGILKGSDGIVTTS